jgi:hypothetical protein
MADGVALKSLPLRIMHESALRFTQAELELVRESSTVVK